MKMSELSIALGDYTISVTGSRMTVEGPIDDVSTLIGQRWLNLIKTEEGQQLLTDPHRDDLLMWVLGVPQPRSKARKSIRPATERQIEFAKAIGYDVPETLSFDAACIILDDHEMMKWFANQAWEAKAGKTFAASSIPLSDVTRAIQWMLNDQQLVLRSRAIRAMYDTDNEGWPTSGQAFNTVSAILDRELKDYRPRGIASFFGLK